MQEGLTVVCGLSGLGAPSLLGLGRGDGGKRPGFHRSQWRAMHPVSRRTPPPSVLRYYTAGGCPWDRAKLWPSSSLCTRMLPGKRGPWQHSEEHSNAPLTHHGGRAKLKKTPLVQDRGRDTKASGLSSSCSMPGPFVVCPHAIHLSPRSAVDAHLPSARAGSLSHWLDFLHLYCSPHPAFAVPQIKPILVLPGLASLQ